MKKLTTVYEFGKERLGYMCNTGLSHENQEVISSIQVELEKKLPGVLWSAPSESLHITLLDWIAPLVDYNKDKEELFNSIYKEYNQALLTTLSDAGKIDVKFSELLVFENAIIIRGRDRGEYDKIREDFTRRVTLIPGTKLPPKIIHVSIARYKKVESLDLVLEAAKNVQVDFRHVTDHFRLVKETVDPMLSFDILKSYPLKH